MKRRREAILGGLAITAIMLAMVGSTAAYSTGGKYNIIVKQSAAQTVLIGQDLLFPKATWTTPPTIYRYVSGDLSNTYATFTGTDGNYYIYNVYWPTSGAYYVNGNAITRDAQLDVEDPNIPLQLKVKDKIVSSLAKGTPGFHTDVGGINLFHEDKVDLVIMGPSGQIKTKNNQIFTDITVWDLTNYTSDNYINTADWDVGHYTFQVKTKPEYACGLDCQSPLRELNIIKATITITAEPTEVAELTTVKLTVTGVPGMPLNVREDTLSPNAYFPAWLYDNPENRTTNYFYDTIDSDGTRVYAVEFNDTGYYTIRVTNRDDPSMYDTVDIFVTEKAVTFDVPGTVVIGQRFMINGTANTGNTVTVAVDDVVVPKLNNIVIDENGEFAEEIDTSSEAAPGAFKNPGSVRLKVYIDYAGGTGTVPSGITDDGSATVFMLNDKGGGIDISTSEVNVGKNETVIVTIAALPGHNVSVTTADTAHTVFEYNQYDFTGTSSNIIKIAPADTTSIPADIGDCDCQTNARNISGVWKTMDTDGTQKFAVHFADTGTYKITATDYGTGYPTANRLDEEEIEINVTGKDVTFDVPSSIVVIGDKIVIKGTSKRGSTVTIAVDDVVVSKLNDIVIDAKGEFAEEMDTSSDAAPASFKIPGLVRLKAYIDYIGGAGTVPSSITDDGSATVFMVSGWLTAGLSTGSVDPGDEFTVTGTAKGSRNVDIIIVAPKGFSGSNIETDANEMYYTSTGVSSTDGAFSKTIRVGDDVDTGRYLVVVLSAGGDGKWGKSGYDTLYNLSDPWNSALCQYVLHTRTQDEMLAIFDNIVGLSDDLIWVRYVAVGNADEDTTITIRRMYTYSCPGTGGHSEYAAIYAQNGTLLGKGSWKGYQYRDYQWITFDNPVTLEFGIAYNYTIKTGSYPQLIHRPWRTTDNGSITCTEFIDANGKIYNDWIPAIRLE
ncbi:MAG: hypothetical protein WAV32_01330 [Halobacteriota archaeon]